MLFKVSKEDAKLLENFLEENNIKYDSYKDLYKALAYEEAQAALDITIENEDLYVTKKDYERCLDELAKEIYNSDEYIMQDLSDLSRDLAEEVLALDRVVII